MLGMFNEGSISNFCSVCLLNKRYSVFGCQNNAKIIAITGLKVHHRHYTPTIFNIIHIFVRSPYLSEYKYGNSIPKHDKGYAKLKPK